MDIKHARMSFFIIFFTLIGAMHAYGKPMKKTQAIEFPSIGKRMLLTTENGVCTFGGERPYRLKVNHPNTNFSLVCEVHETNFNYASEVPVELFEQFKYPEQIFADIKAWSQDSQPKSFEPTLEHIETKKHSWGTEYRWSTPSSGSTQYSYLCPMGTKHCVRVKVGGLEVLGFHFEKIK